jgi:DNA modification methylase
MSQRILVGHVLDRLAELPERAVHCCVTSPPYWGLRAYGTEPQVWTNEPDCDHVWSTRRYYREGGGNQQSAEAFHAPGEMNAARLKSTRWKQDDLCTKCGAWRGELGQEPLPDCLAWARGEAPCPACFVCHLRTIFAAVWRVLRDDGTCWINLGDSYNAYNGGAGPSSTLSRGVQTRERPSLASGYGLKNKALKPKDLMLIPSRVALALQVDGWYVRSRIIWGKTAPMPESVQDRPTSATEDIYLLTKRPRYFYDQQAVREPMVETSLKRLSQPNVFNQNGGPKDPGTGNRSHRKAVRNQAERLIKHEKWSDRFEGYDEYDKALGRNQRNFWLLGPEPYPDAHFAVYPTEIPRRAILAGTSARGVCGAMVKRLRLRPDLTDEQVAKVYARLGAKALA